MNAVFTGVNFYLSTFSENTIETEHSDEGKKLSSEYLTDKRMKHDTDLPYSSKYF